MIEFGDLLKKFGMMKLKPLPLADCVVTVGHTIIKSPSGKWLPSGPAQVIKVTGQYPDGGTKFERTGRRDSTRRQCDLFKADDAIMGGGNYVVAATAEYVENLIDRGTPPKVVVSIGGKPKDYQPEVSEASVSSQAIKDKLGGSLPHGTREVVVEDGLVTKDDMNNTLRVAKENNCKKVSLVAMKIRLPRCSALLADVKKENPEYEAIKVRFVPAERIIGQMCSRKGRSRAWRVVQHDYIESKPYQSTLRSEIGGYNKVIRSSK